MNTPTVRPTFKLGKDLVEGDVIKFWTFDDKGARIFKLMTYRGTYPEIICGVARLIGRSAMRGEQHLMETSIETSMAYELLPN